MIAVVGGGCGEHFARQDRRERRQRIFTLARRFERIAARLDLPANIAASEKKQVRQIRNFLDQAQEALNGGDAQGATNLATKAKLLMDDLEKK